MAFKVNGAHDTITFLLFVFVFIQIVESSHQIPNSNGSLTALLGPVFKKPNSLNRLVLKPSGGMISLKCKAKGKPEPTIEWTKNGRKVERKNGVRYSKWKVEILKQSQYAEIYWLSQIRRSCLKIWCRLIQATIHAKFVIFIIASTSPPK